jgi:hypothetical protein
MSSPTINVEPGVGIFRVIRNLSYKPQYALAEYIDNSISSYENNKEELRRRNPGYKLRIVLQLGANEIRIKDNAAGIATADYPRAFKPAEIPPDTTGLNEFGMGMKTASIWFCRKWKVISNPLNEKKTGIVVFDVDAIIESKKASLAPTFKDKSSKNDHGTEIILTKVFPGRINGQVVRRIREHLADIYRKYLTNSEVEIIILGEDDSETTVGPLKAYVEADALVAPSAYNGGPAGDVKWEKKIKLQMASGRSIIGNAKILARGDTHKAGLYLFRRNRLILSASEAYRPEQIFGQSNSYQSQRLFIELEMHGFEVTHTKDDFIWGAGEDEKDQVIEKIKTALQQGELRLITQSAEFRARKNERSDDKLKKAFNQNVENVLEELAKKSEHLGDIDETKAPPESYATEKTDSSPMETVSKRFTISGDDWIFNVSAVRGDRISPLFKSSYKDLGKDCYTCDILLNLDNAFAVNLLNENVNNFWTLSRVAIATSYALAQSQKANSKAPGYLVTNINRMLTEFLSGSNQ